MGRNAKVTPDSGFLIAAYDSLGDMSVNYGVHVGYSITPAVRRGVFKLRLRAFRAQNGDKMPQVASYETEFPTAAIGSFTAALFQCAVKLEHILEVRQGEERREGAPV